MGMIDIMGKGVEGLRRVLSEVSGLYRNRVLGEFVRRRGEEYIERCEGGDEEWRRRTDEFIESARRQATVQSMYYAGDSVEDNKL